MLEMTGIWENLKNMSHFMTMSDNDIRLGNPAESYYLTSLCFGQFWQKCFVNCQLQSPQKFKNI